MAALRRLTAAALCLTACTAFTPLRPASLRVAARRAVDSEVEAPTRPQDDDTTKETAAVYSLFQGSDPATALKAQILQLGASLDRGQSYNPTAGDYYRVRMEVAREKVEELVAMSGPLPSSLQGIAGEWELVYTTVPHGIFRSSPFFLAVQEAFEYAESKQAFGEDKGNLFFKLHELQTCSWGVSKIGRVAQVIDAEAGMLYSEFDTSIFSLTVIPILGWFKLLPTFGGCVITASKAEMGEGGKIDMEVYICLRP